MKNISFVLIAAFLIICLYGSEAAGLGITFSQISGNVIDFGDMNMGDTKNNVPNLGLRIICSAGPSTAGWTLEIRTDQPFSSEIPNENFEWYIESTTGSVGQLNFPINQPEDFAIEKLIYTGVANEDETEFIMKFQLTLPSLLQSGTYSINNNIVLTITEN